MEEMRDKLTHNNKNNIKISQKCNNSFVGFINEYVYLIL